MLASYFENLYKSVDAYVPSHEGFALGYYGEKGSQVVDGIYPVAANDALDGVAVGDVAYLSRTTLQKLALGLGSPDVARYYVGITIDATQLHGQLRTYLTCCANDEDVFH